MPITDIKQLLASVFLPLTPFMYTYEYLYVSFSTPSAEFVAMVQWLRLCYVSAETAWPCALDPSATLSIDKTDIFPRGRHKSGLYFEDGCERAQSRRRTLLMLISLPLSEHCLL